MFHIEYHKGDWKTPPNGFTYGRAALAPAAAIFVLTPGWTAWLGLGLAVLAASTDKVDGWLAKRNNGRWKTPLGAFLDPIVDKVLMFAVLLAVVARTDGVYRSCVIIGLGLIAVREIRVMVVKSRQTLKSAAEAGRASMVLQSAAMALLALPSIGPWHQGSWWAINALYAAVGASLCSGLFYELEWREFATGKAYSANAGYWFSLYLFGAAIATCALAAELGTGTGHPIGQAVWETYVGLTFGCAGALICATWSDLAETRKAFKNEKAPADR